MKPKLNLKHEVSAPCWAWKYPSMPMDVSGLTYVKKNQEAAHIHPIKDGGKAIRVRVITERAWRQIRRELKGKR